MRLEDFTWIFRVCLLDRLIFTFGCSHPRAMTHFFCCFHLPTRVHLLCPPHILVQNYKKSIFFLVVSRSNKTIYHLFHHDTITPLHRLPPVIRIPNVCPDSQVLLTSPNMPGLHYDMHNNNQHRSRLGTTSEKQKNNFKNGARSTP